MDYSDTTPDVTNTYDRLGRKTSNSSLLSSVLQSSVSYSYDPANLALDTETVTIDPDGSGSLPALTRILDRDQDALGRERSTGILPVTNGAAEHSLTYDFDNSGRLGSVTSPAGTFAYAYTPGSSLIASVAGPAHTVINTWEPNRDVIDLKENRIPSTNTTISGFNYGVNSNGQRTGVQTTGTAFNSTPADWVWGYDALGQVISADSPTSTFDRAYTYDQIGNRKKSADGALVTTGTTATVYDLNPLNQYSQISVPSVQSVVPNHDQDGNATAYPLPVAPTTNATLAYDGENRLISVTTGTTTVSYVYDSQSRRVARTEGTATTLYLYDGWNCLAEYSLQNSSFTIHNSLSWGFDLSGSLQGAGGVGGLLSVTKHEAQGTTHYFPTYDGNGNVSEYLTASGSIAAHYEYDPFGRTIVESGPNAVDFAYRFSTKPRDPATGLYYYGYRFYDPLTGRWINRDPIGERGGVNLYRFVGNVSTFNVDVLGLKRLTLKYVSVSNAKGKNDINAPFAGPRAALNTGAHLVLSFRGAENNAKAKMRSYSKTGIDPCDCIERLVLFTHGREGVIYFPAPWVGPVTDLEITPGKIDTIREKASKPKLVVDADIMKAVSRLKSLTDLVCEDGVVEFLSCNAGSDDPITPGNEGEALEVALESYLGRNVTLYKGKIVALGGVVTEFLPGGDVRLLDLPESD